MHSPSFKLSLLPIYRLLNPCPQPLRSLHVCRSAVAVGLVAQGGVGRHKAFLGRCKTCPYSPIAYSIISINLCVFCISATARSP